MWKGSGDDPLPGDACSSPQSQALDELKEQKLIAQLQEMLNKTDSSSVSQEKVVQYANTLSKMKSRAMKVQQKEGDSKGKSTNNDTSNEKLKLLRQQLEENKAKLAERGKNQRGIEEKVTQIKAQLDITQQQILQQHAPLNISLIEDRVDYSPSESSQELYNILLNKDKRINEMNTKIAKLQANVLDLQENLKEKDSVLEARTKAITLMSENLSKKGKSTLDALDETRSQMTQMQESFIKKEEEFKRENELIKSELYNKNIENSRLQAENEELKLKKEEFESTEACLRAEIKDLVKQISNLENTALKHASSRSPSKNRKGKKGKSTKAEDEQSELSEITKLSSEIHKLNEEKLKIIEENDLKIKKLHKEYSLKIVQFEVSDLKSQLSEIGNSSESDNKLKQQLDEANKNMIKVKAQHKAKVKELNKKMESLKKESDPDVEIVKLETENLRLVQKIAELEEEKGTLQLTMVESKDSTNEDEVDEKLKEYQKNANEYNETIKRIERENQLYADEIISLKEKLENLNVQASAQITTDLTTAQYEEQLETFEREKNNLNQQLLEAQEKLDFSQKQCEILQSEKQDLCVKLETCMQENVDLTNRLEQLSAEKVSSAESIEIVENLTQQEKLELEAYQKRTLPKSSENFKSLNVEVNDLNEESSELLQKIELFTVERREVMEKMDSLIMENNNLLLKLNEVENNRDTLVETYEQLQTEKECLDLQFKDQSRTLNELQTVSKKEIEEYKSFVEIQKQEIKELNLQLLSHNTSPNLQEKLDKLTNELEDVTQMNENYKEIIEENKEELIKYAQLLEDYKNQGNEIDKFKQENFELTTKISDLNRELVEMRELQEAQGIQVNKAQNKMATELINLKSALEENLKQVEEYENELSQNSHSVMLLENQLKDLNVRIKTAESTIEIRDTEIKNLLDEKQSKNEAFECLKKDFEKLENLKEKCLKLELQLEDNDKKYDPIKFRVQELEQKNKEQLEKMKKIAANLKKRNSEYQELEKKHKKLTEIVENQTENKESSDNAQIEFQKLQEEMSTIRSELHSKSNECSELEQELQKTKNENLQISERNSTLNNQINIYNAQIEDLQNIIHQYEMQISGLNRELETIRSNANNQSNGERDREISRLTEEVAAIRDGSRSSSNALQEKIHDQELLIEEQSNEVSKYKEQVDHLEQCLAQMEQRRLSVEQRAEDLDAKLATNGDKHNLLENKLLEFAEERETLRGKLEKISLEKTSLQEENKVLDQENQDYKKQINAFNVKLREFEQNQETCAKLEAENLNLARKCKDLEAEIRKLNVDLNKISAETERNENELQEQLQLHASDRKQLFEQLELAREEITSLQENKNQLSLLAEDLNQKLDQQQSDFDEIIQKYRQLEEENNANLIQLDAMKFTNEPHLSVDQIRALIHEKTKELETLESVLPSPSDFFNLQGPSYQKQQLGKEIEQLKTQLESLEASNGNVETLKQLQDDLARTKKELEDLKKLKAGEDQRQLQNPFVSQTVSIGQNPLADESIFTEQLEKKNLGGLFALSAEKEDPFAFVTEPQLISQSEIQGGIQTNPSNSIADLEQKVKTLEFMLYTTEKEKESALSQCAQLSNEFAQLIYERESKHPNFEDQILKISEMTTNRPKPYIESAKDPNECVDSTLEDVCLQKEAYQCQPEQQGQLEKSSELKNQSATNLFDEILTNEDLLNEPPKVFYEQSKDPNECVGSAEDECIRQKAYQCQPDNSAQATAFGEDEEGWIISEEEAKLEQEHMEKRQSPLLELQQKIRTLEDERESHLREISDAQVKSAKLIKKLKEFKAKNEQLNAKLKNDDFGGLVDAIQDELKSQIMGLEKRIKEISSELERERMEKEIILKRVDVLTAANERMVEMKEKQDLEVRTYQQRNRELSAKLDHLDWGSEDTEIRIQNVEDPNFIEENVSSENVPSINVPIENLPTENRDPLTEQSIDSENIETKQMANDDSVKLEDLLNTIKELTLDNEELQSLLEEQRNQRIQAEKAIKAEFSAIPESEYKALIEERNRLLQFQQQCENLQMENQNLKENYNLLLEQYKKLQSELESATDTHNKLIRNISELQENLKVSEENLAGLEGKLHAQYVEKTQSEASILENHIQIESLQTEIQELNLQISAKDLEINKLLSQSEAEQAQSFNIKESIQKLKFEKDVLEGDNKTLQETIEALKHDLEDLKSRQQEIPSDQLKQFQDQINALNEICANKEREHVAALELLASEWSQHVDQRGNDVAESWSSHLKERESEFLVAQTALRNELNELEEKCNALVNENNELRRNVDAEIRNEVDKISALQQQINDRQAHIAQISETLKLKDIELDKLQLDNANLCEQISTYQSNIQAKVEEVDHLIVSVHEKDAMIKELSEKLSQLNDNKVNVELMESLKLQLDEKNAAIENNKINIAKLKEDLQDYERIKKSFEENLIQIRKYENEKTEYLNKIFDLESYVKKLETDLGESSVSLSNAQGNLQELDYKVTELTSKLLEQQQDASSNSQLQQQIHELQQQINSYTVQLQENYLYIETLNQEIQSYKALGEHLESKDQELKRLNTLLTEKEREFEYALQNQLLESQSVLNAQNQDLDALKRRLQQAQVAHDDALNELISYKSQVEELGGSLSASQSTISEKENIISELETLVKEDEKQLTELKSIIEEQVLKIEEITAEIYEKSQNYDALVAELEDPQRLHQQQEKRVRFEDSESGQLSDSADLVSRAELDIALYTLHQRDVRCEELTVELMQLLEERDTLQLRLSNALRENETYKVHTDNTVPETEIKSSSTSGTIPKSRAIILGATGTELASEATESIKSSSSLAEKLSELKIVGYRKDKTLLDEQELRRLQQMAILEHHKDEVSKLPPEAAARLVDANYTLSRDVQSPSKVLLDWLWGRSTPKVNNL